MDLTTSDSIVFRNVTIKRVSKPKDLNQDVNIEVEVDPYSMSESIETVECTPSITPYEYRSYNEEENGKVDVKAETVIEESPQPKKSEVLNKPNPEENVRRNKRKSVPRKVIVEYTPSTDDEDESSDDGTNETAKPFSCETCGKKFRIKPKLTVHLRVHSGERPFECATCKKHFRTKGTLKVHKDLHLGLKPWACNLCNKTYTTKQQLTIHTRSHTGERPFSCKICQKMFKDKWKLTLHEQTHTGLKPFECDKCDKKYTTKYQLTTHYRIHTRDKLFACDVCTKQFTERSKLKLHEKIHLGVKPYTCDLCDKKYLHKSHLKFHMESIHLTVKVKPKKN